MNDRGDGCFLFVILFLLWLMVLLLWHVESSNMSSELIERGLKAYDTQTGYLKWTDKAGGEKAENTVKR